MLIALRILLVISGGILIAIGGALLLSPEDMYAHNGVVLERDANLLSEIRAPGGLLLVSGLIVLASAFIRKWMKSALFLSALIYLSYGLSRILSIALDGMPSNTLVQATIIELVLGAVCLFGAVAVGSRGGAANAE